MLNYEKYSSKYNRNIVCYHIVTHILHSKYTIYEFYKIFMKRLLLSKYLTIIYLLFTMNNITLH